MSALTRRERNCAIVAAFCCGYSLRECGEPYGITRERVHQIVKAAGVVRPFAFGLRPASGFYLPRVQSEITITVPRYIVPILIEALALDKIVKRAAARCCRFELREDFRQEIWLALLEGRLEACELYHHKTMRRFLRDCRIGLKALQYNHVGFDAPVGHDTTRIWADVIADPRTTRDDESDLFGAAA